MTGPQQDAEPAAAARPWQADVQALLTRVNVDLVEEIRYADGIFSRRLHIAGGPDIGPIMVLDAEARAELLAELRVEIKDPPPGTDITGLRVFAELLQLSLEQRSSGRFASARLGTVDRREGGVLYGHLVLGVDVVGTVRDAYGSISYEQHVVMLPPGSYQVLSPADLTSLADAIEAAGTDDPAWAQIGSDARRAAEATGTLGSAASCSGWSATLGRSTHGTSRIHVTGTCQYPTTGYTAELRPSVPQGTVPETLELDLVVHVPTGIVAMHVTNVTVDYEADAPVEYTQVHIRPDGPVIDVEVVG
jgi:hypothetical protein